MIYLLACVSGFRADELNDLRPGWFNLEADPPTVALPALEAKNGRAAVQPLPPDVVSTLRDYLAGRPADQPLWSGTWFEKAAEMLRFDLEAAGVPYVVEGPDGPLFADFHALRHSYVALLETAGATLKQAMQLARHSDPKLTMARYGKAQVHDLGAAVRKLPSLLNRPKPDTQTLAATGTDGNSCRFLVQDSDSACDKLRLPEPGALAAPEKQARLNPLVLQGVEASCDGLRLLEQSSGGWDRTTDTRLMKPLL